MPEKVLESKSPSFSDTISNVERRCKVLKNSHVQGLVTVDKEGQAPWTLSSNKMLVRPGFRLGGPLVHSCTIFLCYLDDPYRNPNMNNKDH